MRISRLTALIAVAAAHGTLIYYFCLRVHSEATLEESELEATALTFLEPPLVLPRPPSQAQKVPERSRAPPVRAAAAAEPALAPAPESAARIDWMDEAQKEADDATQRQIESEDATARKAGALRAPTQAPSGWSSRRFRRPWVGWSERARGMEITHGALLWHLNEHCVVGIFIVIPGFACRIGKIEPRDDLFSHKNEDPMHFGDWKER